MENISEKIISKSYWREFAQSEQAKEDYINKSLIFSQNAA